jgi:hypothetical protein
MNLSRFAIGPPLPWTLGTEEEQEKALMQLETVPAFCVARVTVPATKLEEFIRVMTDNLARYEDKVRGGDDE